MRNKVLTALSILLTLSWSLTAGPVKDRSVNKIGSHVGRAYVERAQTGEADAIAGPVVVTRSYNVNLSRGTADTLGYGSGYGGQFIQSPGDAMLMTFKMPADGTLKGVNVPIYEWGTGEQQMTVSVHKLTYPNGADGGPYDPGAVDGNGWIGGYDYDATTGEFAISGTTYEGGLDDMAANAADPLGSEAGSGPPGVPGQGLIWPDGFTSATLDPTTFGDFANDGEVDHWINLADFGSEPALLQGDWVGILVAFTGAGGGDDEATGFFYTEGAGVVDPWVFLKFYAGTGGTSGNGGWHIRHWLVMYELAVELTGDRAPSISDVTALFTTLSTEDRDVSATITDDNPSGGAAGVASATLSYSTDGTSWTDVAMTADADTFSAAIAGQAAGTAIDWYISATDVEGLVATTTPGFYTIFAPEKKNLFFYNASDYGSWIKGYYLYNSGLHADFWDGANYGKGSAALFANYDFVAEITGSGPSVLNNAFIPDWLATKGADQGYVLTGDEWLGAQTGWTDTCYTADAGCVDNEFIASPMHSDVLGVIADHNDINYGGSGDQGGISRLLAVADDPISGDLAAFMADSLVLNYDPNYELGFSNWLDGVDIADGIDVGFYAVSGLVDSTGATAADADTLPTGIHNEQTNGSRVVFLAFDPLTTNTTPYHWVGIYPEGPLQSAINWIVPFQKLGVDEVSAVPSRFTLRGNYPNPFNPSTNIAFAMDVRSKVTLTVYSLLGEEVATIHNGILSPGTHEVTWNGADNLGNPVASGVYLYRIEADQRALTGKMMLLK